MIRARDGSIVEVITKTGKNEDHNESWNNLASSSKMLQSIVTNSLANLAKDVAPYTTTETRTLLSENSKDKELKTRMKDILVLVKNQNYASAIIEYQKIYENYNNIAAAYNAAVLYEAQGNLSAAAALMERGYNETGHSGARNAVNRLYRAIREQNILASWYSTGNLSDKVIAHAIDEIYKILPQNAKLWIVNNSRDEKILADSVVDGITSGLVKKGTIVVDRENSSLIEAEHDFQMSGFVSDNDFVSIGNAAGANTLVIITITGAASMRRLQIRVLDIGRRVNLFQSDAGDNWKL
jgi:tetratricopeptide (TPR) repeat protein